MSKSQVSTGASTSANDLWLQSTTKVSTQAGTQADDFKLDRNDYAILSRAVEAFTYDLKGGVDSYTATDDLWEYVRDIFGDQHAAETKDGFVGSDTVHDVFLDEFPSLLGDDLAMDHVIWIDPNEI